MSVTRAVHHLLSVAAVMRSTRSEAPTEPDPPSTARNILFVTLVLLKQINCHSLKLGTNLHFNIREIQIF